MLARDTTARIMPPTTSAHETLLTVKTSIVSSSSSASAPRDHAAMTTDRTGPCVAITTPIPLLRPSYMWPRRNARVAESLAALAAIDWVELSETTTVQGTQVLVLSVYHKRQPSRIPTNRASRVGSIERVDGATRRTIAPDYTLEKTLPELQALRYHASMCAQPQRSECPYCMAFHTLTHGQYSHTALATLGWPTAARRKRVVEGFVNAMVALSVDGLTSLQRGPHCEGFANIPVRIERFLRRDRRIWMRT